jgi:hypothetical protein
MLRLWQRGVCNKWVVMAGALHLTSIPDLTSCVGKHRYVRYFGVCVCVCVCVCMRACAGGQGDHPRESRARFSQLTPCPCHQSACKSIISGGPHQERGHGGGGPVQLHSAQAVIHIHWAVGLRSGGNDFLQAPCSSCDASECSTRKFYTYTKHMQRPRRLGHAQSVTRYRQRTTSARCRVPPSDRAHARASLSDLWGQITRWWARAAR